MLVQEQFLFNVAETRQLPAFAECDEASVDGPGQL